MSVAKAQGVLDFAESKRRKELGRSLVMASADDDWVADAERAILFVASIGHPFTSDNVWETGLRPARVPQTLGALFMRLARAGLIKKNGNYIKSAKPSRNSSVLCVWVKA